jgi:hypothetical protein
MIKLNETLKEICGKSGFLEQGLSYRLFNLSRLAKWLKPYIVTRSKKDVSDSSILMALSRLQAGKNKIAPKDENIKIRNISLVPALMTVTYPFDKNINKNLVSLYESKLKSDFYLAVSQISTELTVITDQEKESAIIKLFRIKPVFKKSGLTALSINFDEKHVPDVGFVFSIIQALTLQYINIWELSSTYTHLVFYLDHKDVNLAMDTIIAKFG